tara:strand:- start:73 stop:813 length:741 start_codon:yes stop_codon:yes gene_type:complete
MAGQAVTKATAAISDALTPAVKKLIGGTSGNSKKNKAAVTKIVNKVYKNNNIKVTPAQVRKVAKKKTYPSLESLGKGKTKKTPTLKDKGSTAGLTKEQKAERAKLIAQSKAAAKRDKLQKEGISKVILPTREQTVRGVEGRKGLQRPQIVESPSGRLKSKQEIDTTGFTKAEKFKQKLQPHADPASVIQQEMRGTGQTMSAKEAEDLGLTIKKYGGMIKKNMGGPVRGVGKAIKGFGNATYSKKMY